MNSEILSSGLRVGIALLAGAGGVLFLHLVLRGLEKHLAVSAVSGERLKRLTMFLQAGQSIGYILILLIVLVLA